MLTVSGIICIMTEPEERVISSGSFFNFFGVSKNPYKIDYSHHKVSVFVQTEKVEKAREKICKGKNICIRMGELNGKKTKFETAVMSDISTRWNWIEVLSQTPTRERQ